MISIALKHISQMLSDKSYRPNQQTHEFVPIGRFEAAVNTQSIICIVYLLNGERAE